MKSYVFKRATSMLSPLLLLLLISHAALAAGVPAQLPAHDNKPGDTSKPVKVYILAGQSNMVGMGEIGGAKNLYDTIYLTSDPNAPLGPMTVWKVGNYQVLPLKVYDAQGKPSAGVIKKGTLAVPVSGVYEVYCDAERVTIDAPHTDGRYTLKPGTRYAFELHGLPPGETTPMFLKKTDMLGNGDLEAAAKREGMFPWLVDDSGQWVERKDVTFEDARLREGFEASPLSPLSNNGKTIGPELGFGQVLGTYHDEQVLLIKTAMGNRSLGFDFRPPSSGRTDPGNKFESAEWELMVKGVNDTLTNIDKAVPGYKGQGYEIAGFVWWQGHKDGGSSQAEYEKHLVNLIKDVRQAFKSPELPVVVATVGFGGNAMGEKYLEILHAQAAVADAKKHPAFADNVATVDTREYWREVDQSPANQDYHYNRNAEVYYRVGDALGRAMVRLEGGSARPLPNPDVHQPAPADTQQDDKPDAQIAREQAALAPIVIQGIAKDYINNPRHTKALLEEASGERPQRANQFLNGPIYGLVNAYNAAGIDDYNWHAFGPDLANSPWQYFSFDPEQAGKGFRKVTWPEGMDNWMATDFDAGKAGFKTGLPPFGQVAGELKPIREGCTSTICGCGIVPRTLWEKEVLMVRGTFKVPKPRDGHRYRIIVGGAAHVKSGEGYALYIDGKLVNQSNSGVPNRQGGQPRGGHLYTDVRDALNDGKATIALYSFLHQEGGASPLPNGHLTLRLQEQKLPPIKERVVDAP